MTVVVSFHDYVPPARYDDVAWTKVRVQEAPLSTGSWTQIDELDLTNIDTDPSEPQPHSFTTDLGTAPDQWYRVVWVDDSGGLSSPTDPVQNAAAGPYATTDELFRILKKNTPTSDQIAAAQGDIDTATLEINAEIDLATPAMWGVSELELLNGVCLDRAADLWRHRESAPGILGVVDEGVPTVPGRYSFARYVARLSVLKDQWGIA